MIAQVCGLQVGEFVHVLGDAHIYLDHVEQVKEQLIRENKISIVSVQPDLFGGVHYECT
jgi:thymidylate synthase